MGSLISFQYYRVIFVSSFSVPVAPSREAKHGVKDVGVFSESISRSLENALLDLQRCSAAAQP
jgi:hypothetical protein